MVYEGHLLGCHQNVGPNQVVCHVTYPEMFGGPFSYIFLILVDSILSERLNEGCRTFIISNEF